MMFDVVALAKYFKNEDVQMIDISNHFKSTILTKIFFPSLIHPLQALDVTGLNHDMDTGFTLTIL